MKKYLSLATVAITLVGLAVRFHFDESAKTSPASGSLSNTNPTPQAEQPSLPTTNEPERSSTTHPTRTESPPKADSPASPSANVSVREPDAAELAQLRSRKKLKPRHTLRRSKIPMPERGNLVLTMKFDDHLMARSRGADGVSLLQHKDAESFTELAAEHGLSFRPQIRLDDEVIERVQKKAADRSGIAQPDLRGLFFVDTDQAVTIEEAHTLAVAMNSHPAVEYANVQALDFARAPEDIAPPTDDFRPLQNWRGLGSANGGASIDYAWSYLGRGKSTRVIDIEQAFNPDHEDLVDLGIQDFSIGNFEQFAAPETIDDLNGYIHHGTRTLGVLAAPDNGYGVVGAAPQVTLIGFASNDTDDTSDLFVVCPDPDGTPLQHGANSWTGRALVTAIDNLFAGDVVLLEVQANFSGANTGIPAETDETVFCTTKLATDAGIIVVGAAGNGNIDTDQNHATFNTWRSWGDSGAIIVGAGSPDSLHVKLDFSSYGSRVDIQAWGLGVLTTGSPDQSADSDQDYSEFSGTSSASAVVAGTCLAVQSARSTALGIGTGDLDSVQMRDLLKSTGNPQTSGPFPGLIGPAVDAQRAIDTFLPAVTRPQEINPGTLPVLEKFGVTNFADLTSWIPTEDIDAAAVELDGEQLILRNAQPGIINTKVHSIADWVLKFEGMDEISNLVLQFDHAVVSRETFDGENLESYVGMADADGIFISNDGARWTRVCVPGMEDQQAGSRTATYSVSMHAAAMAAGFPLDGVIRLRFQRFGPREPVANNGRRFDNVMLFEEDRGEFQLERIEIAASEDSQISFTVQRDRFDLAASVDYELLARTAGRNVDFSGFGSRIFFPAGTKELTRNVPLIRDSEMEHTETFQIVLKKPSDGLRLRDGADIALAQIIDDDWDGSGFTHFAAARSADIPAAQFGLSGPAPIPLTVSGIGSIGDLRVKISDLNHSRPTDLDIFLEAPDGTIRKLMCDYGDFNSPAFIPVELRNLCFNPDGIALSSNPAPGQPTLHDVAVPIQPFDHGFNPSDKLLDGTTINSPANLDDFVGADPNGIWKLHIIDDSQTNPPSPGELLGGWELLIRAEPPLPKITGITHDGTFVRVFFGGQAGTSAQMQLSRDLENWFNLGQQPLSIIGVPQTHLINPQPGWDRLFFRFRRPD